MNTDQRIELTKAIKIERLEQECMDKSRATQDARSSYTAWFDASVFNLAIATLGKADIA